jgi:archaellum component FlaC
MVNEITIPMLHKVRFGYSLTNEELKRVINFYTELSANLDTISAVVYGYDFSAQHARKELERLKIFANNRGMDY